MRCDLPVGKIVREPQNYRRTTLRTELSEYAFESVDALSQIELAIEREWRRRLLWRGLLQIHPRPPLVECRLFFYEVAGHRKEVYRRVSDR